ncbi:MAG: class I adenylate-forming enzyme family protein [Acidimicrobiales bacterium]
MTSTTIDAGDDLPLTVGALLRARASEHGSRPFVVCDDDVLTYDEAATRSARLARALMAVGAGKGTHIGLLHPNGADFVVSWLAAARIGAVTVPLSTFSTPAELGGLLRSADIEVLLSAASYRSHDYPATLSAAMAELDLSSASPLMAPSVPTLRQIRFTVDDPAVDPRWKVASLLDSASAIDEDVLSAAESDVTPADRLVIVHTSGSTSEPKGVIHTHGALIRHLDNLNQVRRYDESDVLFSNSPLFWIGGFAFSLLGTLVAGARLVCSNAVDAAGVLDVVERERPTMACGFAQSVAHLPADPSFAARDLSSIRRGNLWPILPSDVSPADPELRHSMFGMSETGSVCLVAADETDLPEHQRGSFGRPAPGFEAKVIDPDTGTPCGVDVTGELWFRGPFVMEGYYGRERSEAFDPDGWFRTGDRFAVDADGWFYFKGRLGDMIKTSGANVSPREVEAAIEQLTGLRSHVTGVDDGARGQVVAAAIVVPDGEVLDPDRIVDLRRGLAGRLSAYKVPKIILSVPESDVPMMSSGKLDARALKDMLDVG